MPARSMSQMRGISLLAGPNVQITCVVVVFIVCGGGGEWKREGE